MSQTLYAAIRIRSLVLEIEKLHGALARPGERNRHEEEEEAWVVVQEDLVDSYDCTVPLYRDRCSA